MGDPLYKHVYLSLREYEALEGAAEEGVRYEFIDGMVYAMSGGTVSHHQIIQNALLSLVAHYRPRGCRVFTETVKLAVAAGKRYVYPDVMVTCSERDKGDDRVMREPVLIVEVLSDTTENRDLKEKVDIYQEINTLQAYVIVDQYTCWLRVYERDAAGAWRSHRLLNQPDAALQLSTLDWHISLAELYRDVVLTDKRG
jgi:Uma2 family endonuclease